MISLPFDLAPQVDAPIHLEVALEGGYYNDYSALSPALLQNAASLSLDLVGGSADALLTLLRACPNLIKLKAKVHLNSTPPHSSQSPVEFKRLTEFGWSFTRNSKDILDIFMFPSLQSISLEDDSFSMEDVGDIAPFIRLLRRSDQISTLSLRGGRSRDISSPSDHSVTLHSVTKFVSHGASFSHRLLPHLVLPRLEILEMEDLPSASDSIIDGFLENSPFLVSVDLARISGHFICTPGDQDPLHLPSLTSLKLNYGSYFPHRFCFPQLRILYIDPQDELDVGLALRRLIQHATPPLVTLALHSSMISDEELLWCLERLPTIETLELVACGNLTDDIFRALAAIPPADDPEARWLLPQLHDIKIFNYAQNQFTYPTFFHFLASRNSTPPTSQNDALTPRRVQGRICFGFVEIRHSDREEVHVSPGHCRYRLRFSISLSFVPLVTRCL